MSRLLWLPDVLRSAGLPVRTVAGWEKRGASGWSLDAMNPAGVIAHATVTRRTSGPASGLGVVTHGRAGLAGPIAQLHLSRVGVFTVIAAGVANHAGRGGLWGVTGNNHVIGIEAENDNGLEIGRYGKPEPWPSVEYTAYVRAAAAILGHLKRGADRIAGHKEWARSGRPPSGKTDPLFDMGAFRSAVAKALDTGPAGPLPGGPRPGYPTLYRGTGGPEDTTGTQRYWVALWHQAIARHSPNYYKELIASAAGGREVERKEIGDVTLAISLQIAKQVLGDKLSWRGAITQQLWAIYPPVR
jgi:hypothetical protein